MPDRYVLNADHSVERMDDIVEWAQRFELDTRVVAYDTIEVPGQAKPFEVSTVFIGIDHRLDGNGPPLVFETAVFGPEGADIVDRYSTYAEAQRGHDRVVERVRSTIPPASPPQPPPTKTE